MFCNSNLCTIKNLTIRYYVIKLTYSLLQKNLNKSKKHNIRVFFLQAYFVPKLTGHFITRTNFLNTKTIDQISNSQPRFFLDRKVFVN